jgi:hypothetical protein
MSLGLHGERLGISHRSDLVVPNRTGLPRLASTTTNIFRPPISSPPSHSPRPSYLACTARHSRERVAMHANQRCACTRPELPVEVRPPAPIRGKQTQQVFRPVLDAWTRHQLNGGSNRCNRFIRHGTRSSQGAAPWTWLTGEHASYDSTMFKCA